jgi:hypothetical protein
LADPEIFPHGLLFKSNSPLRTAEINKIKCQSRMGNQSAECGKWEIRTAIKHRPPRANPNNTPCFWNGYKAFRKPGGMESKRRASARA